ncbi:hypothetical protein FKP32DRAFT_1674824 [Trametes sanguinea]|nr:hypothetical protein FKP32DRAFT_1674824 [Trametes sanguinea]
MPRAAPAPSPRSNSLRARFAVPYTHSTFRLRPLVRKEKPETPREPSTSAERFVVALLGEETFELEQTSSENIHDNITLTLQLDKKPGAIEGIFQDDPTYTLLLIVEPGLVMRTLRLAIDTYEGEASLESAPTWVKPLASLKFKSVRRVRTYDWVLKCLQSVLFVPGQAILPAMEEWRQLLQHTVHIKTLQDAAKRPRRTGVPRPRPRPRRPEYDLQHALEGLHISNSEDERRECKDASAMRELEEELTRLHV